MIKKFAQKAMGTQKVKIDSGLNKAIWAKGVRNIPRRIRVRIARQLDDDEERAEDYFSLVTYVGGNIKMSTRVVADDEE